MEGEREGPTCKQSHCSTASAVFDDGFPADFGGRGEHRRRLDLRAMGSDLGPWPLPTSAFPS